MSTSSISSGKETVDPILYSPIAHANTAISYPTQTHHAEHVAHDLGRRNSTPSRQRLSLGRTRRGSASSHNHVLDAEKEKHRDLALDVNLPYRTLSANANMDEYRLEVLGGEIPGPVEPPEVAQQAEAAESLRLHRTVTQSGERRYRLVTFEPNDKANPKNWSKAKKWYCTMVVSMTCFVVAMASSVITADIKGVGAEFGVSEEVTLLSVSLFVIGFGVGPLVFAPLSEVFGRRVIYASTLLMATIFIIPCAVAKNISTLLVCRLIDGISFSAPMTLVGGTLADLWRAEERGVPMAAFSAAPFLGPAIGPLVGGYLSDAKGWRWLYWIQLILAGTVWLLITFTVPETYAPIILKRRAKNIRNETGEMDYVTEQELDTRPLAERLRIFLIRPMQLLFLELIVFLLSLYMSVLYGLLYMFFVAYPIVFQEGKGFSAGKTGLMFIPVAGGVILSAALSPLINRHYIKRAEKYNGNPPAELRLIPMIFSCWFVPIGLFVFAWTSYAHLSWAGPAFGGMAVGFGFLFLYNSANNYIVDSYQHQAASALAAKTCLRSFWGAGVVLFTVQMYHRLGDQWASTLLAFISLACCAIPFLFWIYGSRIRAHSRFAYSGVDEEFDAKASNGKSDLEKQTALANESTVLRNAVAQQPVAD